MKTTIRSLLLLLILGCAGLRNAAAQGTAFTYQGRLNVSGAAASGNYDFTFNLYSVSSGGSAVAGPVTLTGVGVTNGLFVVTLDFGSAFPPASRWLEIGVRTNGGSSFTTLSPRQLLTPTPYSIQAENAAAASSVSAANITGTLLNSALPSNPTFGGTITAGAFSGNGASLTNIPEAALNTSGTLNLTNEGLALTYAGTIGVQSWPMSIVVVTNINGAGHVDAVVANQLSSSVTVLTNNGAGVMTVSGAYGTGQWPMWVTTADVNGDGKPDLITANMIANTLSVLTNNGSGGFVSAATLNVGLSPACVLPMDVNNDGKPDLISANSYDNTLTILTNNGSGSFVLYTTLAVGPAPKCVIAADINGDGKSDMVVANSGTNTVTVLFNNGNSTFVPTTVIVCGTNTGPVNVVAADFNGDNYKDLATANADGSLSILTNNGNGTFTLASNIPGLGATSLSVADFNLDGKNDLAATASTNSIYILLNTGNANFTIATTLTPPLNGSTAYASAVTVDLNGDGRPDLLAAGGQGASYVVEALNNSSSPVTTLTLPGQNGGLSLSPGFYGVVNVVGGAAGNSVDGSVTGSVIAGGGTSNFLGATSYNRISADFSSIGGGSGDSIGLGADHSVIGGGWNNQIVPWAYESVVAGGQLNTNGGQWSFIGGGYANQIQVGGSYSAIIGGDANVIQSGAAAFIGGGYQNTIQTNAYEATIAGGWANVIGTNSYQSAILGGQGNTISGGAAVSAILGGQANTVGTNASGAAVIAGSINTNNAYSSVIGAGYWNVIQSNAYYSIIGSGYNNTIAAGANDSAIVVGWQSVIDSNAYESVISGGFKNHIYATDSGIGSGDFNVIGTNAVQSFVGGGLSNTVTGRLGTIPGGDQNVATNNSFAAGHRAKAVNPGAFVWADSQEVDFSSSASNQFDVRASGGANFVTSGAGMTIDGQQVLTSGSTSGVVVQTNSSGAPDVVLGSSENYAANGVVGASIGGGGAVSFYVNPIGNLTLSNVVSGNFGTVSGGGNNVAGTFSVVGGGEGNAAGASYATVGGGIQDTASGTYATVGGGNDNTASGNSATVPGGLGNVASGDYSFAAGNSASAVNQGAFVWADSQGTTFSSTANDQFLVRARGGVGINTAKTTDNNFCINTNTYLFSHSLYLRGDTTSDHNHGLAYCGFTVTNFNTTLAPDGPVLWGFTGGALATRSGNAAMLSWNSTGVSINATNNLNGSTFFVNGNRSGAFGNAVAIIQNTNGSSSEAPALRVVGTGVTGSGILSVSSQNPLLTGLLAQFGNSNSFVVAITNDGTIYCKATVLTSDRNAKENFTPLDTKTVLAKVAAMPVTEWNYKDDSSDKKHIGPVAQDFQAAFGLNGKDDRHISVVDESGVALAAIQGLNQKVDELNAELKRRDEENEELKARLSALEQLVMKSR